MKICDNYYYYIFLYYFNFIVIEIIQLIILYLEQQINQQI